MLISALSNIHHIIKNTLNTKDREVPQNRMARSNATFATIVTPALLSVLHLRNTYPTSLI